MEHVIEIHRATSADAGRFDRVARDVFDAPIVPERLARFLADDRHVMVVATVLGEVIGQARAVIHRSPDQDDELYIDNLGVAPAWQRRGVGRRLVLELRAWGRERGCESGWLGTEPNNDAAIGFYASVGASATPILMLEFDPL